MKKKLELSIIIPVYNSEKYLTECLNSILMQNYNDYEIIIINDGSTDESQKIIDDYVSKYNNITAYQRENKGSQYTRIEGVKKAKGCYIMFVDADDWLEEKCLEIFMNEVKKEDYDIVRANYKKVKGKKIKKINYIKRKQIIYKNEINKKMYKKLITTYYYNSACMQIIKKDIIDVNCINTNISMGEDMIFNLICYRNVKKMKLINIYAYNYRINDKSLTNNVSVERLRKNIEDLFEVYSIVINEIAEYSTNENIKLSCIRYLKEANYFLYRIIINTENESIIEKIVNNVMTNELTKVAHEKLTIIDIIIKKQFIFLWLILNNKKEKYIKLLKIVKKLKIHK